MSTKEERNEERDRAFMDVLAYMENPECEEITIPEVVMTNGTIIPARVVRTVKKPDWI